MSTLSDGEKRPRGRPRKPESEKKKPKKPKYHPPIPKDPNQSAEQIAQYIEPQKPVGGGSDKSLSMEQRQARTSERVAEQMEMLYRVYQNGRVDLNDTDDVFQHGMTYMRACVMKGHLPSLIEFCVTLGHSWQNVQNWTRARPDHPTSKLYQMFRDAWTDLRIGMGLERVTDNVLAIYLANNSGVGLSNNPVQAAEKEDPLGERKSAEEIKEEYKDIE